MTTTINHGDCAPTTDSHCREASLRSGRSLVIESRDDSDEIRLRAADGTVEVTILLTDAGAAVRLKAADLSIDSPQKVSVNCSEFHVNADEKIQLYSDEKILLLSRDTFLRSADEIQLNAGFIRQQGP